MSMPVLLGFLLICSSLPAQELSEHLNVPGPEAVGDTFELTELDIRLFDWRVCFVGSSLYGKVESRRDTSFWMKITELPIPVLAFEVEDARDDNLIRLWTGQAEYSFDVRQSTLERVDAYGRLSSFLAYPIVSAAVGASWSTCEDAGSFESTHRAIERLQPTMRHEVRNDDDRSRGMEINGVSLDEITWALRSVNLDPHRIPSLREFIFNAESLLAFEERVEDDLRFAGKRTDLKGAILLYFPFTVPGRAETFHELPAKIDEIGPDITGPALIKFDQMWGTTSAYSRTVSLVNQIGDTIYFDYTTRHLRSTLIPYWTLRYGHTKFRCFDPTLSRLLLRLLPEYRADRERQEKVDLLYAVAWQMGLGQWE